MPLSFRRIGFMGAVFCFLLIDFWLRSNLGGSKNVCNEGIAFGISIPENTILLGGTFLLGLFLWLWKAEKNEISRGGYVLLIAGGTGNMIDRLVMGCVHDYLSLPFYPVFPSFNLSDMMLSLGVACLVFGLYRKSAPSRE